MAKQDSDDPLIGTTIAGRYRIVKRVGAGGMGSVYLAEQGALRQEVALKILAQDKVGSPQAVERFQKEALFVAGLKHPNIVGVYDLEVSEETGDFIIVMEYLRGMDLRDALRATGPRFPWQRTIPIVEDVCRALAAAHDQGVIHRDLKPENIFLVEGGRPDFAKVLDFGVAKATRADRQLTQTGMLVGTPSYIAPEQIKGRPVAASDLYSLGIMWFEMIAGRKPFIGEGVDLLWMHVDDEPPTLAQAAPDVEVPVLVEEIIGQLLEKNPRKRPGSAELLMEDLQTLIERSATGLRLPPPKREDPGATYSDEQLPEREITEASHDIFTELSDDPNDQSVQPTEVSRRRPAARRATGLTNEEPVGVLTTGDLMSASGRSNHELAAALPSRGSPEGETFVEGLSADGPGGSNPNHVGPMVDDKVATVVPRLPLSDEEREVVGPNPNHIGPPSNDHEETYTTNERPSRAIESVIRSSATNVDGPVPSHAFNSPDDPTRTIGVASGLSDYLGEQSVSQTVESPVVASVASMASRLDRVEVSESLIQGEPAHSAGMRSAPQQTSPYATQPPPPKKGGVLLPVLSAIVAGLVVVGGVGGAIWWFTKGPGGGAAKPPTKVVEKATPVDAGSTATGTGGRTITDLSGRPAGPGEGEPDAAPESSDQEPETVATNDSPRKDTRRRRRRRTKTTAEPSGTPARSPEASEPDAAPPPVLVKKDRIEVSVATRPSAQVIIDGKKLSRKTPLAGSNALKLKPGRHRLILVDDDGERYSFKVKVPATQDPSSKCRILVVLGGRATAKGGVTITAAK